MTTDNYYFILTYIKIVRLLSSSICIQNSQNKARKFRRKTVPNTISENQPVASSNKPILIKCNSGDIFLNVEIAIKFIKEIKASFDAIILSLRVKFILWDSFNTQRAA
jgi:hypothetical protein